MEDRLSQMLTAMAPIVKKANDLNGGGGYENWTIVQYLLNLTSMIDYEYQREFQVDRMRVDIAFNMTNQSPQTPLILTEWKCNPDATKLSTGCGQDIDKFTDVLRELPAGQVLPLPLVIGIGPPGANFPDYKATNIGDVNMKLYTSTRDTWETRGVLDKTWYSRI
jgi:hypothetical protein